MRKIITLLSALTLFTSAFPAMAADSVSVEEIIPSDFLDSSKQSALGSVTEERYAGNGIRTMSEKKNPSAAIAKGALSGSVNGGAVQEDGSYIKYDNGETASVYTLTIDPGNYTIDGFCAAFSDGTESLLKDFGIPEVSGGDASVNIIINRPEASIALRSLKSGGKDAFGSDGTPYAYEIVEGNAEDWRLDSTGHYIEEYIGSKVDELVIPNMINGKKIFGIENDAYLEQNQIGTLFGPVDSSGGLQADEKATSIVISNGITILGSYMFFGCGDIQSVTIPASVQLIGYAAFYKCTGLTGGLDLSDCPYLYPYAFCGCTGLTGALTLSEAMTEIPRAAFAECPLSGELVIPDSVTDIGAFAFELDSAKATSFTSLTLSNNLKTIGAVAFQYQNKLANALTLPDGLEHIGDLAFDHCQKFTNTSLTIPASVKTIGGDLAIVQNKGTENTGYGGHVFYDAFYKSTEFVVADGNENFKAENGVLFSKDGTRLVFYPTGKTDYSYVIPDGVTQIDEMAFGHSKVQNVTLPDSYVIETAVPENILNQDGSNLAVAFYVYNSCKNVYVNDTNPNYISIDGVVYSTDGATLWYMPVMRDGAAVQNGCATVKNGAFFDRAGSVGWDSISIPASVTLIEDNSLSFINACSVTITVDENNTAYKLNESGKLVKQ